jgi:hypothetical protein
MSPINGASTADNALAQRPNGQRSTWFQWRPPFVRAVLKLDATCKIGELLDGFDDPPKHQVGDLYRRGLKPAIAAAEFVTQRRQAAPEAHNKGNGKLDRPGVVQQVDGWIRVNVPGDGVDRLLTRPRDSMVMALCVARVKSLAPAEQITRAQILLGKMRDQCPDAIGAINLVCRIAMNARKQGKLHPHASSPATKAAQTRKGQKGVPRT